ncbi:hypothetical protein DFR30_2710 [Thiogranum longum]|uniref:Molecular chaperone n=1 Tax=Thiogranum longum TaxID=1537524 RepID=A0A4R1HIV2_9GAMM|nr:hypothetical protein [Thiogranum longum]TCK19399.1 hypothetical protein DFR30_2710 [Thiogranum longum]
MSLILTTPEQHDFQDPTLELDAGRLYERLSAMPAMNAGESVRQLLLTLEPLNEQRLDAGLRLELLDVYRPFVQRLFDGAEPIRLRQQPLGSQQRKNTVDDIERLCLAMANGYKLVIKAMHSAGQHEADRVAFGRVVRAAVRQLAAALLHSYRYYRPEPPFVFLELNQLYRLARHHGIHDWLDENETGSTVSLAATYQAVCLLSLLDPFAAEEGQADLYYRTLLQYAGKVRIVPGNSWQGVPEGLFFIDLMSDSRPRHCVFLTSPVEAEDPYLIDARVVLQSMHKMLLALSAERRRQRSEAAILRHLLPEVTPRDKRRSRRLPGGSWIHVVVGLEAIHDWLLSNMNDEAPEPQRWVIRDRSEQGYRLGWSQSSASALQVGDLVCVVADGEKPDMALRLLAVRWVRDEREKGTELGVEAYDGVPAPVELELEDDEGETIRRSALFLPSSGEQGSSARLVAPAGLCAPGREVLIHVGDREVKVVCAAHVEQSPGFDCFEFTAAG